MHIHSRFLALLAIPLCVGAAQFEAGCEIPFDAIKTTGLDIDEACGVEGEAAKDEHRLQNRFKNNLCATGKPIPLTRAAFITLQKAADKKVQAGELQYGSSSKLPDDRNVLREVATINGKLVGEGKVVQHVGFVHNPRYSNKSKGESVNCKKGRSDFNDIHIDILQKKGDPVCRSITVEIIPHFRPAAWERETLVHLERIERPVRFTGQLFFDGSHKPCKDDFHGANPKRSSVWEIHPVYAIHVCKNTSLSGCAASVAANWVPLDQWVNIADDDDE